MKNHKITTISIALALALSACDQANEKNEDGKITELLIKDADATSNFPKTLNIQSVIDIYSPNAKIISDGKQESIEDIKKLFEEAKEQIRLGNEIYISERNHNIKIEILSQNSALAQLDSDIKIRIPKENKLANTLLKCTALFKKENQTWLITNEHCSSSDEPNTATEASNNAPS